jgi:hypothetical protein
VDGVINGAGGGGSGGTTGGTTGGVVGSGTGMTGGGIVTGGRGSTGFGGSGVVQAANASATTPSERGKLRRVVIIRTDMWILMVEAGVALFLLVFIVWWTMYSGKKPTDHAQIEKKDPPESLPKD